MRYMLNGNEVSEEKFFSTLIISLKEDETLSLATLKNGFEIGYGENLYVINGERFLMNDCVVDCYKFYTSLSHDMADDEQGFIEFFKTNQNETTVSNRTFRTISD